MLPLTEFKKKAKQGNLVPVVKEIILDCETPVSLLLKMQETHESVILLESVEYGDKIGRYSIIGFDPSVVLEKRDGTVSLTTDRGKQTICSQNDPLLVIKDVMAKYTMPESDDLPTFGGGFVGFLSYENVAFFEDVTLDELQSLDFPDAVFFLLKHFIVFDHQDKKVRLVSLCDVSQSIETAYKKGVRCIAQLEKTVRAPFVEKRKKGGLKKLKVESNMTRRQYEDGVRKIKKYINAGDVIQVVFSQRFSLGTIENDFNIYRALRTVNPSPYMFYFKHKGVRLIGSSPELLVKKEGVQAEVRPIAGTRKRGKNADEDNALARDLASDKKELAEHLMLVDLGRNDLGRVCAFDSIRVSDYAHIEKYSHVMHLVSNVSGTLKESCDAFDLLRATFPAGTLSGAPKIRAMEIINELEPSKRGPYGGSVGYFSFTGNCDMCITIRTIMVNDKKAYLQAGAGIVYDSVPSHEYQETINKAQALVKAVEVAISEF